ncbi:MAG: aminotransferase class I/II-fold pyridoxal phosphate-dependent enzyme, partial [Saprospiraceae bacterium]|nr:aminotransferase class I/II-fold pyridoxal phosphate-dependent enzyme [Saprospiraceae bacterium]
LEILENRLCLWDGAEDCAVFESGMSAISTVLLEFLNPGDILLYSMPVYGGTDHFINHFLPRYGITSVGFSQQHDIDEVILNLKKEGHSDKIALIYIETPANPTNALIDISKCSQLAKSLSTPEKTVYTVVDNTYLGPIWQHPLKLGADIVVYSATKYIGGHSDVIAGAVLSNKECMSRIKTLRTFLGNMAGPWTGWLLLRSLETLKVRFEQQTKNAIEVAKMLDAHPLVEKVYYLGLLNDDDPTYPIYKKQCSGPGAMVSFLIKGKEKEAFAFLNHLQMIKLAVSLGSTESLAEHPHTMTHAGIDDEHKQEMGITENLIRLSIGVEFVGDIIRDITEALENSQ